MLGKGRDEEQGEMEILIGLGALLGIGLLAIAFGAEFRDSIGGLVGKSTERDHPEDPHSTLGVTRQVLGEIGERETGH